MRIRSCVRHAGAGVWISIAGCGPGTAPGDGEGSSTSEVASTGSTAGPSNSAPTPEGTTTEAADGTTAGGDAPGSTGIAESTGPTDSTDTSEEPPLGRIDCRDEPPEGAQVAPPLPLYDGTCPELAPGLNVMQSEGFDREFLLVVPEDFDPTEPLPVIFLWHWLGGSADDFLEDGDVQNAVDQFGFIAVIPESSGELPFRWPFTIIDSELRVEQEFRFFDDMLACVGEQFPVEPNCVSSAGVSAGGLFTTQLAAGRGQHLASFMSLSGGSGGAFVRPWSESAHTMPAMVLWGGEQDFCVAIDFNTVSLELEADLTEDGHFILECIHNCMHTAPPFEVERGATTFAPMWEFAFAHPYWLEPGQSPYLETGVPPQMPEWCGIGMGGSTPREGECGPNQC
ncbi:MAG: hypothetical protein AAF799_32195 [Myxococcota bacterium]